MIAVARKKYAKIQLSFTPYFLLQVQNLKTFFILENTGQGKPLSSIPYTGNYGPEKTRTYFRQCC